MKPITKRAQEARMRQNGVTPLKQVDLTKGTELTKEEQDLVTETKKETKQQGTSADDANQVAQGNKSMVTQPRSYTFEAKATPKQKARQEVGAQKIRQRGADKLDKIADKQNRKRAGKELKGLRREAMDKKRLDGLTFKERREVGQAFRRGDYKSVLGSEDAARATQLRGTKKGYIPDDEKPSTSSKPKIELTKIEEAPKNKTKEKESDQPKTIKPATRREINASKRDDKRRERKANKADKKEIKAIEKDARKESKANIKEGKRAQRGQIDKDGNVISRKQMRKNRREGFAEYRKGQKAKKQEARDQKKLDKAMDKTVKRGIKSSEKIAKKFDRQLNTRKDKKAETKQIKEDFANDPISARFKGKSPKQVERMINRDRNQRLKTARKSERLRKRGKLGPNESLVSKRDQRNRANYERALEMSKGSTPVNLPVKEIPKISSPMKMMGVTGNSGPLKKGYFKNK